MIRLLHSVFWMREALGEKEAVCRDAEHGMAWHGDGSGANRALRN
jgi:hypothetical protein